MGDFIKFFIDVGKLKRLPRKGWVINQIKNPESIADHTFRAAMMAWVLGEKKKLNREKILKMILVHDLWKIKAGDITPYDPVLPKSKKELVKLMRTWPRHSKEEKQKIAREKYKKEWDSLVKVTEDLPPKLKKEIRSLWLEFKKGLTKEARFAYQVDKMENLLQALEYWKRYKKPPLMPWWWWAREFFDDPLLIDFMTELDKAFLRPKK